MKRRILALAALAVLGIALDALDLVDWSRALEWARARAGGWSLPAAIVLAQLLLFTFGQPGSILFWAAALLYPPPLATLILTAGGTAGSLGAKAACGPRAAVRNAAIRSPGRRAARSTGER